MTHVNTVVRHLRYVSSWKLFCDLHLQSFHVHWRFFFSVWCVLAANVQRERERERDKVKEGNELESEWPSLQQRNAESSQQQSSWVLVTVSLDYQWQPTEKVCALWGSPLPHKAWQHLHPADLVFQCEAWGRVRDCQYPLRVCARVRLRLKVCEYAGRFQDNIYMWAEATVQRCLNLASSQSVYSCYNTHRQFRLSSSFYQALI